VLEPIRTLISKTDESFEIEIFSLNYDLTFEDYFNKPEETLAYNGFEGNGWVGNYENHQQRLNYYKLHGSLDWYLDKSEERVKQSTAIEPEDEPLIIFGSISKMMSFDPFLFMLSKFREKLQKSILYVVIGYSFHDKYINNMLIQQLAMTPGKKLLVVDPCGKSSEEFVQMLESVQKAKSINDKINFTQISNKKVDTEAISAKDFYKGYFGNSAARLIKKVEELVKEDRPF
jgi:hypothetical protein